MTIHQQIINKLLTFSALIPQDHTINFTPTLKIVKEKREKKVIFIFRKSYFQDLYFSNGRKRHIFFMSVFLPGPGEFYTFIVKDPEKY